MDETEALLKYQGKREKFASLVNGAFKLGSTCDSRPAETWRLRVAVDIFTKLTLHGMAIRTLFPPTPPVWDIGSLAVLTRAVIDTYFALFYFAVDKDSDEQIELRHVVGNYNLAKHRHQILDFIGSEHSETPEVSGTVDKALADLRRNAIFQGLEQSEKRDIEDGRKSILLTNSALAQRAGISPRFYRGMYKYLSGHVHTLPIAIQQMNTPKRPDQILIVWNFLDLNSGYLALAIRDFVRIFPASRGLLSDSLMDEIRRQE